MDDLRNTSLYKRLQSITEEDIINCRNRIVERIRLREEGNLSNSKSISQENQFTFGAV